MSDEEHLDEGQRPVVVVKGKGASSTPTKEVKNPPKQGEVKK
jgi:hypothetical protein